MEGPALLSVAEQVADRAAADGEQLLAAELPRQLERNAQMQRPAADTELALERVRHGALADELAQRPGARPRDVQARLDVARRLGGDRLVERDAGGAHALVTREEERALHVVRDQRE